MARYLVELYLSRAGPNGADGAAERARSAAEAMAREGEPVQWLRTIFVPEDETCFYLFEAGSAELVQSVGERAGISFDRILEASETEMPADVRTPPRPVTSQQTLGIPPMTAGGEARQSPQLPHTTKGRNKR